MEHLEELKKLFSAWKHYMGALALYQNPDFHPSSKQEQKAYMEQKEQRYFALEVKWKSYSSLSLEEALAQAIPAGQDICAHPVWIDGTPIYPLEV